VRQPARIGDDLAFFRGAGPDVIVVMAYGQILPEGILAAPRLACLNLHASLLPEYRGASPIQAAIRDGKSTTGITVIYMDQGLDTGDILLADSLEIAPDETGQSLHDRLAALAPRSLQRALGRLAAGSAPRTPQSETGASHCRKLNRKDGAIDWSRPAVEIERWIRAYHPWPGTATTWVDGPDRSDGSGHRKMLKVFPPVGVGPSPPPPPPTPHPTLPGTVLSTGPAGIAVATGQGAIFLRSLQLEGRRRMLSEDFMKGNPLPANARFGC